MASRSAHQLAAELPAAEREKLDHDGLRANPFRRRRGSGAGARSSRLRSRRRRSRRRGARSRPGRRQGVRSRRGRAADPHRAAARRPQASRRGSGLPSASASAHDRAEMSPSRASADSRAAATGGSSSQRTSVEHAMRRGEQRLHPRQPERTDAGHRPRRAFDEERRRGVPRKRSPRREEAGRSRSPAGTHPPRHGSAYGALVRRRGGRNRLATRLPRSAAAGPYEISSTSMSAISRLSRSRSYRMQIAMEAHGRVVRPRGAVSTSAAARASRPRSRRQAESARGCPRRSETCLEKRGRTAERAAPTARGTPRQADRETTDPRVRHRRPFPSIAVRERRRAKSVLRASL